jgi:hypothetical protein
MNSSGPNRRLQNVQHALVDVAAEIQTWAAKTASEPFREAAGRWVAAIERQVSGDLQAVDALNRLDERGSATAEAKRSLCEVMGLDGGVPMLDLLQACKAVFESLMQMDTATTMVAKGD